MSAFHCCWLQRDANVCSKLSALLACISNPALSCLQDGVAMLWDLAEGKRLYSLDAGDVIHALCFSPNRYWLVAATQQVIKVRRQPVWSCAGDSLVQC